MKRYLSESKFQIIQAATAFAVQSLEDCYVAGKGFYVSPNGSYKGQRWWRDIAAAARGMHRDRLLETIRQFLAYQREDGAIPYRIDEVRHPHQYWLGWTRNLAKDFLTLAEPRPIFRKEGRFGPKVCDTVPSMIVSFFAAVEHCDDKEVILPLLRRLDKAVMFEESQFFKKELGLFDFPPVHDWMDDLRKPGVTTFTNILYLQAFSVMVRLYAKVGASGMAKKYLLRARMLEQSLNKHLWNPRGYYQTTINDSRFDSAANAIYAAFSPQCQKVPSIFEHFKRVNTGRGFYANFDQDYPHHAYRAEFILFGFTGFANQHVYPWIAHLQLHARVQHLHWRKKQGENIDQEIGRLAEQFVLISRTHLGNGAFHEVIVRKSGRPAHHSPAGISLYRSTPGFLASIGTFLALRQAFDDLLA